MSDQDTTNESDVTKVRRGIYSVAIQYGDRLQREEFPADGYQLDDNNVSFVFEEVEVARFRLGPPGAIGWYYAGKIGSEAINEPKVDAINVPTSGQVLSYNRGTSTFGWVDVGSTRSDIKAAE